MKPEDYIVRIRRPDEIKLVCRDLLRGWSDHMLNSNPRERVKLTGRYTSQNFNKYLGENINIHHSVVYGNNCLIGNHTKIGENSIIKNSLIGENCTIGNNVEITDSVIFNGVTIVDNVKVTSSLIGEDSTIEDLHCNQIITGVA
jgi:translation initiation factor eIF-2B subunit epsilon